MEGAKTGKFRMQLCLLIDKIVNMAHCTGFQSHRQNYIPGDTGRFAGLQKQVNGSVQFRITDLIEIPDALGGLVGNGIGVNMGMEINNLQNITSIRRKMEK